MRAECYRLLLHRWNHFHRFYSLSLSLCFSLSLSFVFSSMLGFLSSLRCFSFLRRFSWILLVGYFLLLRLRVNDVIANTVARNETLCYTTARSFIFFFLGMEKRGAFLFIASRFISISFKLIRISFKGLEW